MKLSLKNTIIGGLAIIALIIASLLLYNNIQLQDIDHKDHEQIKRTADLVLLGEMKEDLFALYTLSADAIINRNISETESSIIELINEINEDKSTIKEMVDTDEEIKIVDEYFITVDEFTNVIKEQTIPELKKGIETNSEKLKKLDGIADEHRDKAIGKIALLIESFSNEQKTTSDEM